MSKAAETEPAAEALQSPMTCSDPNCFVGANADEQLAERADE